MIRRGRGKGGPEFEHAPKLHRLDERKKLGGLIMGEMVNQRCHKLGWLPRRSPSNRKSPSVDVPSLLPHKKRPALIPQNEFLDSLACDLAVWRALAVPGWAPAEPI